MRPSVARLRLNWPFLTLLSQQTSSNSSQRCEHRLPSTRLLPAKLELAAVPIFGVHRGDRGEERPCRGRLLYFDLNFEYCLKRSNRQ